jgi:hypothetical protein
MVEIWGCQPGTTVVVKPYSNAAADRAGLNENIPAG